MAEYTIEIHSPHDQERAFAYLADLRNLPEWDPNVLSVDQVVGVGGGPGAEFDVTVESDPEPLTLRYRTLEHDAPTRVVIEATSNVVSSHDVALVDPDAGGSRVTYTADLTVAGLADGQVAAMIGAIADRAAEGLSNALDGRRVR